MRLILFFLLISISAVAQWTPYNVNMQVKGKFRADKQVYFPLNADSSKVWTCINDSTGEGQWRYVGSIIDTSTLPYYHDLTSVDDTTFTINTLTGRTDTIQFISGQSTFTNNAWLLTGNAGTNDTTNFIGTTDNRGLQIKANVDSNRIQLRTNVGVNQINVYSNQFTLFNSDGMNSPITVDNRITETTISGTLKYVDGTQGTGKVLTSDANGLASWQSSAYGEMGFGDSTRTVALSVNTPAKITNTNKNLWNSGAVTLNDVTYRGDSIIIETDGIYHVNGYASVSGSNGSVLTLKLYLNGSLACVCNPFNTLSANRKVTLVFADIMDLNAGDVIEVYIENTADSNDIDAISGKLSIHQIR